MEVNPASLSPWPQPKKVLTQVASPVMGEDERKNLIRVWESGRIGANGFFSNSIELELSKYFLASSLVVANGSVAISLALTSLDIGPGDEVLIPDLTYAATASAVINVGATPILCDVSLKSWNISTSEILQNITEKTKAIIVVHLYGLPCDMTSIMEIARKHKIAVVEDCAEAFGATYEKLKVGTFGSIGTFSFFPNKLITAGEGGLVVTRDKSIFERMKLLRGQGMSLTHRYFFLEPGFNFRMTELQASVLFAQFNKLEDLWLSRELSENRYRQDLDESVIESDAEYEYKRSPWIFTCRIPNITTKSKLALAAKLAESGIETRPVFYPLSTMPAFSRYAKKPSPNAALISQEGISLPTGIHVTEAAALKIIGCIRDYSKNAIN